MNWAFIVNEIKVKGYTKSFIFTAQIWKKKQYRYWLIISKTLIQNNELINFLYAWNVEKY